MQTIWSKSKVISNAHKHNYFIQYKLYIIMKTFYLKRNVDISGVSGTGIICEGVELRNGKVILSWLGNIGSIVIHDNIDNVKAIHCHNGSTELIWT